jgi:hypothetical protein
MTGALAAANQVIIDRIAELSRVRGCDGGSGDGIASAALRMSADFAVDTPPRTFYSLRWASS